MNDPCVLMVGPAPESHGGIGRVVKTWQECGLFDELNIVYISTLSVDSFQNLVLLLSRFIRFVYYLPRAKKVYIHMSSRSSFYRKSFFMIVALIASKNIIVHIHPNHFIDFLHSLPLVKKFYVLFLLKRVKTIVTLSVSMKESLSKILHDKKVVVLNNPVNVQSLTCDGNFTRKTNKLVFLGSYLRGKGIYDLVDAVEKLVFEMHHDIELEFYGNKDADSLRNYVQQKNLIQHVKVNDWIGEQEKIRVLCESAMLILPSHSEGVPIVILEAMATHTPIVATSVGGLVDILVHKRNALVVKVKDVDDLRNNILMLMENPNLRNEIAQNAYQDVVKYYDIDALKPKIANVIMSSS